MSIFIYVIFGILLTTIGIPFLSYVCDILNYLTELVKAKISVKIAEYNSKIHKLQENEQKEPHQDSKVIGFVADWNEEIEDEEQEDD